MDIRESAFSSIVIIAELLVIYAQEVQHGCVQIIYRNRIFLRLVSEFVRRAVTEPAFHSGAASQTVNPSDCGRARLLLFGTWACGQIRSRTRLTCPAASRAVSYHSAAPRMVDPESGDELHIGF